MRMASRYTRSPKVATSCSGASGSSRRSFSTRAASGSTRPVPPRAPPGGEAAVSCIGVLMLCLLRAALVSALADTIASVPRVQREVVLELDHALLHHRDVLGHLRHQDGALEGRHHEARRAGRIEVRAEPARLAAALQRGRQHHPPSLENVGQPLPEALVNVGQLAGEIAHGAAAHAVALALDLEQPIQERAHLVERIGGGIDEGRLQGALQEALHHAIDDGEPKVFLAAEVVIEVALADSALPQHVVERGAVIAAQVDEPRRRVQDLVAGGRCLGAPDLYRHRLALHPARRLYQLVGTEYRWTKVVQQLWLYYVCITVT